MSFERIKRYDAIQPGFLKKLVSKWQLYAMILPAFLFIIIFCYVPMYGVLISFKDFNASLGIMRSPWVGFKYFETFFTSPMFGTTLINTLKISIYTLIFGFPIPIIFALLLNKIRNLRMKKFMQTVSYAPYFISTVVLVSMLNLFLAPNTGLINDILGFFRIQPINFMIRSEWFRTVYVVSGIWQTMGWNAIIYLAALSGVSPDLYEASIVDGASKLKQILYIDIPSIVPTIVIMLILNAGSMLSVGYEKAFLMQQGMNLPASEIISTYVYKVGLMSAQYSYATAIGVFNSIVNFTLIVAVNFVSRKTSNNNLW